MHAILVRSAEFYFRMPQCLCNLVAREMAVSEPPTRAVARFSALRFSLPKVIISK
jgi:hypothetical protein